MDLSGLFKTMVSITQFNKGKASQLFSRAQKGETLLVIKNNTPVAVILSPEEYKILRAFPKLCAKADKSGQEVSSSELNMLLDELKAFDENGDKDV